MDYLGRRLYDAAGDGRLQEVKELLHRGVRADQYKNRVSLEFYSLYEPQFAGQVRKCLG